MNGEVNGDLPEGWACALLGEVADVIGGGTPKSTEADNFTIGGIPWITPADLSDFRGVWLERGDRDLTEKGFDVCSARMLPRGAVLMSSRAPIGYVAIAANPLCTNQGFKSFVLPSGLDPEFVFYWLKYSHDVIEEMGSGSTFLEVSGSKCKEIPLHVPPFAEQRRIVAAVEAVLAKVNAARDRLNRVPAILKRFRQSVLAAACSGRLTADWRNAGDFEREPPTTWQQADLGSLLIEKPQNGVYKPQSDYDSGALILRIDNFYDGAIEPWANLKRVRLSANEIEQYGLANGDVIVNRVNSFKFLGKCALVRNLSEPCVFESNMMRLKLDGAKLCSEFAVLFLCSAEGRDQIRANAKHAVNQSSINQTDVQAVELSRPPLDEQREIVRRVGELFSLADRIEARLTDARQMADRLTQAVLAKAFRGGLVPTEAELARREKRDYEPAAKLLERIRAERDAPTENGVNSSKRPNGRRKVRNKE